MLRGRNLAAVLAVLVCCVVQGCSHPVSGAGTIVIEVQIDVCSSTDECFPTDVPGARIVLQDAPGGSALQTATTDATGSATITPGFTGPAHFVITFGNASTVLTDRCRSIPSPAVRTS